MISFWSDWPRQSTIGALLFLLILLNSCDTWNSWNWRCTVFCMSSGRICTHCFGQCSNTSWICHLQVTFVLSCAQIYGMHEKRLLVTLIERKALHTNLVRNTGFRTNASLNSSLIWLSLQYFSMYSDHFSISATSFSSMSALSVSSSSIVSSPEFLYLTSKQKNF